MYDTTAAAATLEEDQTLGLPVETNKCLHAVQVKVEKMVKKGIDKTKKKT